MTARQQHTQILACAAKAERELKSSLLCAIESYCEAIKNGNAIRADRYLRKVKPSLVGLARSRKVIADTKRKLRPLPSTAELRHAFNAVESKVLLISKDGAPILRQLNTFA